jgi:hypothetical protein
MSFKALDTSQNTLHIAGLVECLKQNGVIAVGRYYTSDRNNGKILTGPEAKALSEAGIGIWAVYQDRQNQASDFSSAKGKASAEDALTYAQTIIAQPKGSGIYFAVDYDASEQDYNSAIKPYFEAIQETFAANGSPYRAGVYGSGLVCQSLLDAGLIHLTWISQSTGFQGTSAFAATARWNLTQKLGVKNFCKFADEIDPNDINATYPDFGQFTLPGAAIA